MSTKIERKTRLTKYSIVLIYALSLAVWPSSLPVLAQLSACSIGMSPHSVGPGSNNDFSFGLYNGNSTSMMWVQVTRPPGNYVSLVSAGASAWQANVAADTVTFTQGSLPLGYSQGFDVQALASNTTGGPANWTVQASDNADGSNPITCDGDMSLTIQPQASQITISNVRAASVGSSSVSILWDTDVASTSQVAYGSDQSYGSTSNLNTNLVTTHTVNLTGLAPDSSYHYQITSTTPADGGTSASGDNTFLTAVYVPPTIITQTATSGLGSNVPGAAPKAVPTDTVRPTVSLAGDFTKPFKEPPLIGGVAADNEAIARVEYSLDGGKNWLPVDHLVAAGKVSSASTASVTFNFVPVITSDGNYSVEARAIDTSGNQTTTPPVTLVTDRLPPQVGEMVISFGPEVLTPSTGGLTTLVAGTDYRLTTSSIGGATSITIQAHRPGMNSLSGSFGLVSDQASGLWSGILSLNKGGLFDLTANCIDGAGNQTVRSLGSVAVMPAGRTIDTNDKVVNRSKVTLYYLEPASKTWVIWDGAPYGEANPQTNDNGQYNLMAPAGTYYFETSAEGHTTTVTHSFSVTKPTSLTGDLVVGNSPQIHLGSLRLHLPSISFTQQPYDLNRINFRIPASSLIGTTLPNFTLPGLSGGDQRAVELNGRPTVISLVNTWSPASTDQLKSLAALQRNPDVGVVPVFLEEDVAYVKNYLQIAGSSLNGLADPDGLLVNSLGAEVGVKHIFVDRSGHIKKVMVGVMSEAELNNELGGL